MEGFEALVDRMLKVANPRYENEIRAGQLFIFTDPSYGADEVPSLSEVAPFYTDFMMRAATNGGIASTIFLPPKKSKCDPLEGYGYIGFRIDPQFEKVIGRIAVRMKKDIQAVSIHDVDTLRISDGHLLTTRAFDSGKWKLEDIASLDFSPREKKEAT